MHSPDLTSVVTVALLQEATHLQWFKSRVIEYLKYFITNYVVNL